jgi:argininosuccinate lyase
MGFIQLSDAVTTGSSLMPQKKNPDVAELIRGKTGRVTASLMGALMMLKGLPLSYNRDLQEDKIHLFEGLDTTRASVRALFVLLNETIFDIGKMRDSLVGDFSNATDLSDFLVRKGVPFRQAHQVVGAVVRHCIDESLTLENIPLDVLKKFHPLFDESVLESLIPETVVAARKTKGGTAPSAVSEQLRLAKELL